MWTCVAAALLCSQCGTTCADGATGWQSCPGRSDLVYYDRSGQPAASWDSTKEEFRLWDRAAGEWSEPTAPPWSAPAVMGTADAAGTVHYGVERPAWRSRDDGATINGHAVPVDDAISRLTAAPAISGPPVGRLFLVGDEATTAPRAAELAAAVATVPELAGWVVQAKPADHWWVTQAGFQPAGPFDLYALAADGKVIHHQNDWAGGAQAVVDALRRPRPDFAPLLMPDLRPQLWVAAQSLLGRGKPFLVAISVLGVAFLFRKGK